MTTEAPPPLDLLSVPLHGIQVIEASAGTGKTHTITRLFLRAMREQRLHDPAREGLELVTKWIDIAPREGQVWLARLSVDEVVSLPGVARGVQTATARLDPRQRRGGKERQEAMQAFVECRAQAAELAERVVHRVEDERPVVAQPHAPAFDVGGGHEVHDEMPDP